MENPKVQEIVAKQLLTVARAVEDKIDDEIAALEKLDLDDLELLRERRLQQMKKMAEKRSRWIVLGHGEYSDIMVEKDFTFCGGKCKERCKKAGVLDRCLRYCGICCKECKCVPSGTYGNKHECPCYRDKRNDKGTPKCP